MFYSVSLKYMDSSIVNTYLWIKATAISKISKIVSGIDIILNIWIVLLIKAIKIWPAIIFAHNRTDNVIGRINKLIDSIRVIKWDRAIGVDKGTKCLIKWVVFWKILNSKIANHKGSAILSVVNICLVKVNT